MSVFLYSLWTIAIAFKLKNSVNGSGDVRELAVVRARLRSGARPAMARALLLVLALAALAARPALGDTPATTYAT